MRFAVVEDETNKKPENNGDAAEMLQVSHVTGPNDIKQTNFLCYNFNFGHKIKKCFVGGYLD